MVQRKSQQKTFSSAGRSKLAVVIAILLVLGAAAWVYTAPRRTLEAIREAARAGDSERLAELVDFPAVRESLKEQFRALIAEEMEKATREKSDNPLAAAGAAFGMMLANTMIDTLVDAAVSPSGIAKLASGDRPAVPGTKKDSAGDGAEEKGENVSVEQGYESASRYVVKLGNPGKTDEGVALTLRRSGLSWRLTSVRFEGLAGS